MLVLDYLWSDIKIPKEVGEYAEIGQRPIDVNALKCLINDERRLKREHSLILRANLNQNCSMV